MPTRLATWSDLLPASKVLAEAFHHDHMFGDFVHPRRNEFPNDVYLYWLRFLREAYYTEPGEYLVVSYKEAKKESPELERQEIITGVAHWVRNYSVPPPTPWLSQLALKATESYNKLEALYHPNRAPSLRTTGAAREPTAGICLSSASVLRLQSKATGALWCAGALSVRSGKPCLAL
jgi:hypothetical protein